MNRKITCFVPLSDNESLNITVASLKGSGIVGGIFAVVPEDHAMAAAGSVTGLIKAKGFASTEAVKKMAEAADTEYILIYGKTSPLDLGKFGLDRMIQVCDDTDAGFVYSDYYENRDGRLSPHPVTDYQEGSLRDDFNFGSVILYRASAFRNACMQNGKQLPVCRLL